MTKRGSPDAKQTLGLDPAHAAALIDSIHAAGGRALARPLLPLAMVPTGESDIAITFESFGVRVGVSVAHRQLLEPLIERLPHGWTQPGRDGLDIQYRIQHDGQASSGYTFQAGDAPPFPCAAEDLPEIFERMLEDYLAEHAYPWLFVHAGVVGWEGRGIVLPGTSFSGKSTLVAALVGAGATYFSDEFAVLDAEGRVYPFPRRISLRRLADRGGWEQTRVAVPNLRPDRLATSLPIRLVAALRHEPDRAGKIEELTGAGAILALCDHTIAMRARPSDAFAFLGAVVKTARVVKGYRGEAQEAASWLLREVMRT